MARFYIKIGYSNQRTENGYAPTIAEAFDVGVYTGYIYGIVEMAANEGLCLNRPDLNNGKQTLYMVGKYLDNHPEEWNLSTVEIICKALRIHLR
jgi:hypothetical protein